jgi:hypothetical protein
MEIKEKSVLDNIPLGLGFGIIIPILTLIFINAEANRHLDLIEFLSRLNQNNKLSGLFSLCAIPNLGLFFLFMWKNNYRSAKGVIFATILMVILVFTLKFS